MSIHASKLKGLMAENEIVAVEIARRLKLNPATVSCVVRGYGRSARVESVIADALNMNRDDIFPVIPRIINKADI